ncbi:bifunctional metallophosphatase/5'-nucleotidase [Aestuariibaculum sediminum]|uniref:Metallophosphatase n=1 Tax=Aestuariibaculum sediminum TaxID=2770637 RepID=A0A8J6Q8D0_9FLAO|nr:metallophosphatase [Aestuariibaculum sediminum]MBD0832625.1 metallophosphatase [Aestuariibaculum sediminum]
MEVSIDPFNPNYSQYVNQGGIARRAKLIENIRKENPNTLVFDAGDIFQGTPYFNYYGGSLEFKLMSMLKYDAATLGNHDFDNGIEGLYKQLPHASFDFICSNYDFSNTIMHYHTKPFKIYILEGKKIDVFGLGIDLLGKVVPYFYKETKYLDPVEISQDMTRILKYENQCDLIICLSHLGYEYDNSDKISDLKLATLTKDIDLIIGGHTHTFMQNPTVVKNLANKTTLVNQAGCWGIKLGRLDFYFNNNKPSHVNGTSINI